MKKYILVLISCVPLFSCYEPEKQKSAKATSTISDSIVAQNTIVVSGSTTMQPILENVANYFTIKNTEIEIKIFGVGSHKGMEAIWNDSADIAMSSHEISDSVVALFRKKKIEYAEFLLAGDALVFIVNTNNSVKKLTSEQIKSIFTGEITNWAQLGGDHAPIQLISREAQSGTYSFFKEAVLGSKKMPESAKIVNDNILIMKEVSNDKHAIGYTSFSNLDYSVDPLDISFDRGYNFVSPRIESINNLKYKYFRGLFLYYKPEAYNKIKPFLDTAKSDYVQKIIKDAGYIPLSHRLISNQ